MYWANSANSYSSSGRCTSCMRSRQTQRAEPVSARTSRGVGKGSRPKTDFGRPQHGCRQQPLLPEYRRPIGPRCIRAPLVQVRRKTQHIHHYRKLAGRTDRCFQEAQGRAGLRLRFYCNLGTMPDKLIDGVLQSCADLGSDAARLYHATGRSRS